MKRAEVLWRAGRDAYEKLRQLEVSVKRLRRTGYTASQIGDRICEFCVVVHRIRDTDAEVLDAVEHVADAIAALEKLRVLLKLTGKPKETCLTASEVRRLQRQLRKYAEKLQVQ